MMKFLVALLFAFLFIQAVVFSEVSADNDIDGAKELEARAALESLLTKILSLVEKLLGGLTGGGSSSPGGGSSAGGSSAGGSAEGAGSAGLGALAGLLKK